jgi:hypothetical protein
MMATSFLVQDTVKPYISLSKDSLKKAVVSLPSAEADGENISLQQNPDTGYVVRADSTALCHRYSLDAASFYDKSGFLRSLVVPSSDKTIINISDQTRIIRAERNEYLISRLREGEQPTAGSINYDMTLLILLGAAFILTIIRSSIKNFQPVSRFLLFKGISDHISSDSGIIFHWQTTLLNLMSFIVISLFAYHTASLNEMIPPGISGISFWLICLAVIIAALTVRHIVCLVTGNLSGQREIFNDYLVGIYKSYHFAAFILFTLIIIRSFTLPIPGNLYLTAGIITFALMYLIRITRLFLIFLNRNISILYLILYLCGLEILPLAIIIRYFSGPVNFG